MKSIISFLTIVATLIISPLTQANEYEREGRYIYHSSPWTNFAHDRATIEYIYKTSFTMLQNEIARLHDEGMIPKQLEFIEELHQLRKAEYEIDEAIDTLNEWAAEQLEGGAVDLDAVLPKAFLVFAGSKASFGFKISGGGQLVLGLVIMPTMVQKYDTLKNKKIGDPYLAIRTATVFWFGPELGVGIGGGVGYRVGFGLVWSDKMNQPEQFWGWGLGAAGNAELGTGLSIKTGFVSNTELPDWIDAIYATAAVNIGGARAAVELHANAVTIFPIDTIFEVLNASGERGYKDRQKDMKKETDKFYKVRPEPKKPTKKPRARKTPPKDTDDDDSGDSEHDGISEDDADIETGPFDYRDDKK